MISGRLQQSDGGEAVYSAAETQQYPIILHKLLSSREPAAEISAAGSVKHILPASGVLLRKEFRFFPFNEPDHLFQAFENLENPLCKGMFYAGRN